MKDHFWVPPQCGPPSGGNSEEARHDGAVVIPISGCRNGGSGYRGGGYICTPPTEHHLPVYFDFSNTGAMSGGETAAGITGVMTMVGE